MKKIISLLIVVLINISFCYSQDTESNASEEPLVFAERMPEFPGGDEGLMRYLQKNIKYPAKALVNNIQGVVMINFVVEKNGKITKAKVTKGIGGGCDEVALKVVKNMPKWKPGMQAGKAVPVYFDVPVNFKID
jgi:periplasmic protein TonB